VTVRIIGRRVDFTVRINPLMSTPPLQEGLPSGGRRASTNQMQASCGSGMSRKKSTNERIIPKPTRNCEMRRKPPKRLTQRGLLNSKASGLCNNLVREPLYKGVIHLSKPVSVSNLKPDSVSVCT